MHLSLLLLLLPCFLAQYCVLPAEPNVQRHDWETYGPNDVGCGELRSWAMNHGCFINGTNCADSCTAGNCYCIYSCAPGYCMTQFNPSQDNINSPSHGVKCQLDGTIAKVYNPTAPLCVPCTARNPNDKTAGVITVDGAPSPATFVSSMTRSVPVCGLMDPGIDDGLQKMEVTPGCETVYAHMFPKWWYLPSVQSQIYIQIPGIPANQSCVTKRNPNLSAPQGNAGFFQVAFTAGGGMQLLDMGGGQLNHLAFGQCAFFTDFGNSNNIDLSMCWKFYGSACLVNFGIRAYVCGINQTIPNCKLACNLFLETSVPSYSTNGLQATICKRVLTCNLASCPDPTKCLGIGDPQGCNPVANIDFGEKIVYEFYDKNPSATPTTPTSPTTPPKSDTASQTTAPTAYNQPWWIALIVLFVVALVLGGVGFWYYRNKKKALNRESF